MIYTCFFIENPEDYCKLFCIPNKLKPSYRLMDKVIDGTKCGPSGFGICVNGICVEGGCDNILHSSMVLGNKILNIEYFRAVYLIVLCSG